MMERLRARLMQNKEHFNNAPLRPDIDRKFGQIRGIGVGMKFTTRDECARALVHTQRVAGISGSSKFGAYSVVLSGAYEDDDDEGETFIYTGTGGRNNIYSSGVNASPQTEDQSFDHPDNRALQVSASTKRPVRVVRGANNTSGFAPPSGYRYDGLYIVEEAYLDKGKSGFVVCKFRFRRVMDGQPPLPQN